jgi:hypothetical protein
MSDAESTPVVVALMRRKETRMALIRVAEIARARGLRLAGMVQREEPRADRSSPDMILVDLAGGTEIKLSEERGEGAKACHLNAQSLEEASGRIAATFEAGDRPDLLLLSKFAAREIEGHGFRQAIEKAVLCGIPVLVGVAEDHLAGFRAFGGGYERIFEEEAEAVAFVEGLATARGSREG